MKKEIIIEELERLKGINNFRKLKICNGEILNLSSNDYLGLANDKELREEFYKNYRPKLSSSSSRLASQSSSSKRRLTKRSSSLAFLVTASSCCLFRSGKFSIS